MPDRVESFGEVDSSKSRPRRARLGCDKPIRNRLRKEQNLIESRPSRAETGPGGERIELDFKKKSRRDRIMCSKSFDTQEVREIGQKEAGESKGFPVLWMGIIDVLQMEGKECKDQERLLCGRKSMLERERALTLDRQLCLGQWQGTKRGFVAAARNSAAEKREQKVQ